MKKLLLAGFGLSIAGFLSLAPAPTRADGNAFRTPTGNIGCAVYEQILRCDLLQNLAKLQPRPKDCELDYGSMFSMSLTGKPDRVCAGDTVVDPNSPTLDYGRTWNYQGFQCRSEMNGLTCTNTSNHGWFLKKAEQRLY